MRESGGPNAINPPLHDGRHAKPPKRELKDDGICRNDLGLFCRYVGGLAAMEIGVSRLGAER